MVKRWRIKRCVACAAGRHHLCEVVRKSKVATRTMFGRRSREVVYTTCECGDRGHGPLVKSRGD